VYARYAEIEMCLSKLKQNICAAYVTRYASVHYEQMLLHKIFKQKKIITLNMLFRNSSAIVHAAPLLSWRLFVQT
jgi:hypothetical protein